MTTEQLQALVEERVVDRRWVTDRLGITRQTLYEKVRRGTFPAPIAQFGGSAVWDRKQVQAHIDTKGR